MITEGLEILDIEQLEDLVTDADRADLRSNFALALKGVRGRPGGWLATKDYGTKHMYADYPPMKIYDVFNIYDQNTGRTYDIMVGLSEPDVMYLYVNDPNLSGNGRNKMGTVSDWIELSKLQTTTINSATGTTLVVALTTTYENELQYWIAVSGSKYSLVLSSVAGATTSCTMLHNVQTLGWSGSVTFYRNLGILNGYQFDNGHYPHVRWNDNEALTKVIMYYGDQDNPDGPILEKEKPMCFRRYNSSRGFFYRDSSALLTLPADWYVELQGGGLIPDFESVGTSGTPVGQGIIYGASVTGCTGTIAVWTGTTLTGSGTNFTSKLKVGRFIWQKETGAVRQVVRINSDTECIIDQGFNANPSSDFGWGIGDGTYDQTYLRTITDNTLDGLQISLDTYSYAETVDKTTYLKLVLTAIYEGYQESDPIYKAWIQLGVTWPTPALGIWVDPSRLNRNISGFNVYAAKSDSDEYDSMSEWPDADSNYILMYSVKLNEVPTESRHWQLTATDQFCFAFPVPVITKAYYEDRVGSITLAGALAHASDTTRSYMTPRFGVRIARGGGVGITAVDEDDNTIRLSSYDGYAQNNDDNFPDLSLDANNLRLKISLSSRGELIGLTVINDMLVAVKRTEIELIDLQGGNQTVITEDVFSKRSIVKGKRGLYWAGRSGFRLMPRDGTGIRTINPYTVNLYNGDLRTLDEAYPRVADSDRAAIIAGMDPLYEQIWFYLPTRREDGTIEYLSYRFNETDESWTTRELNIGTNKTIQGFITRKDNSFAIFYGHSISSRGILKYPNRSGSLYWEDDVSSADATANKGIPMRIRFNCGELYSVRHDKTAEDLILDFSSSLKTGQNAFVVVKLYANGEDLPFDTQYFRVDHSDEPRLIELRSNIETLEMELVLEEGKEIAFREFDLSTVSFRVQPRARVGKG